MRQLTAGSLFSGIGGIDLAFALADFNIKFQVDLDGFCQKVLRKHGPTYWPDATIYPDVRSVTASDLGYVDVLFGGFPCQDISNAGKRAGIAAGEKSGLWREFKRLIGEMGPRIVFLENVPTITVKGRGGVEVITDLAEMGYDVRWGIVSAADAGAPHQRDRWFCVGYTNGLRYSQSSTASKLRDDEERHDAPYQQERTAVLCASLSDGEVVHPNGQQCEEHHTAANGGETGFIGGRPGPDEFETVDNSNGKRQQKGGTAGNGNAPLTSRQDAVSRIERGRIANQSGMGRAAHGLSRRMDGHQLMAHQWPTGPHVLQLSHEAPRMMPGDEHTINRIRALGNAVVPQCVYPIAVEIAQLLNVRP